MAIIDSDDNVLVKSKEQGLEFTSQSIVAGTLTLQGVQFPKSGVYKIAVMINGQPFGNAARALVKIIESDDPNDHNE